MTAGRCPFWSRLFNMQCDLPAGHGGDWCSSKGDGFASGWDPTKQPDPLAEPAWKHRRVSKGPTHE